MAGLSAIIKPHRALKSPLFKLYRDRQIPWAILQCQVEASTIILDDPNESPLISGQYLLDINNDDVEIESLHATLSTHVLQKKPFKTGCKDCKNHVTELKHWRFTQNTNLGRGLHQFPFSYILPHHLPPSMDTPLVSVSYELQAAVCIRRIGQPTSRTLTLKRALTVARSLSVPNSALYSRRIFPAAGIEVACLFGSAIDPIGPNKVSLTLHGLMSHPGNGESVQIWRLFKGSWRLEETVRTVAMACDRHVTGVSTSEEDKGRARKKLRILGEDGIYNGWNSDVKTGTAEMEFEFCIQAKPRKRQQKYAQDTGSVGETEVTHSLVVELVLVKEHYPKGRPDLAIRTGVGRILRSEHQVVLSDYASPSTSPVEESLPFYEDLPCPPTYSEDGFSVQEEYSR
ncbi:hypothetical protein ACJ41O_012859 [Fusarium nematophilum]